MKPFEYFAPTTLPEAIETLARYNGDARALAGGTDLLIQLKEGRAAPKVVVNIKRIPELRGIAIGHQPSILSLGALTTAEDIRLSPIVREHAPGLADAAATIASVQIRNLATIGGNVCNASPAADLTPILIALDAAARIAGPEGERRVSLDEFFTGPGTTRLKPGELLISIEAPLPTAPALYLKHAPRAAMDIAVVGVGLSARTNGGACVDARIVLGAVAPTPLRARRAEAELIGQSLAAGRIRRAAQVAADEARPIDDVRGSAWYRRRMVEVLTRRGLAQLISEQ
jgi:carbon-monoxide dehydrogenase medium subunit